MSRKPGTDAAQEHYVYLLRDPRKKHWATSIFYVGKGTKHRSVDHLKEALAELKALRADAPRDDKPQLSEKIKRIAEIQATGRPVRIDVIAGHGHAGLTDDRARDIEAGLIAALRMTELGNKIAGRGIRLVPQSSFTRAAASERRALPTGVKAVVVPVSEVWGGTDYTGTLISAPEDAVWKNARQLWSPIAASVAADISERATSGTPAVLLVP
jgi:hypothetical protein